MENETQIVPHGTDDSLPAPVRAVVPPAIPPMPPDIILSPKQKIALEMVMIGAGTNEIAATVRVDRGTIWRWRSFDANFIAALNQWRRQLIAEMRDRVLSLSDLANKTVRQSIEKGDARIALHVMDKMRTLEPGPTGPIDAFEVFGMGVADEAQRGPLAQGFAVMRRYMTPDQGERLIQLVAMGIIVDNRRAGRATAPEISVLAGDLIQEGAAVTEPDAGDCSAASDPPGAESATDPTTGGSATKGIGPAVYTRVHARVLSRAVDRAFFNLIQSIE